MSHKNTDNTGKPHGVVPRSPQSRASALALGAILTALSLIFSYVEALFPLTFAIPGIKLGLANIVVVLALYMVGSRTAFTVNLLRILLAGLLFGNMFSILYSLAGGFLSFAVMFGLKKSGRFSIVGVSMAGGVFHNLGQLTVAALAVSNLRLFYYFPVLLVAGMITGILIGVLGFAMLQKLSFYSI